MIHHAIRLRMSATWDRRGWPRAFRFVARPTSEHVWIVRWAFVTGKKATEPLDWKWDEPNGNRDGVGTVPMGRRFRKRDGWIDPMEGSGCLYPTHVVPSLPCVEERTGARGKAEVDPTSWMKTTWTNRSKTEMRHPRGWDGSGPCPRSDPKTRPAHLAIHGGPCQWIGPDGCMDASNTHPSQLDPHDTKVHGGIRVTREMIRMGTREGWDCLDGRMRSTKEQNVAEHPKAVPSHWMDGHNASRSSPPHHCGCISCSSAFLSIHARCIPLGWFLHRLPRYKCRWVRKGLGVPTSVSEPEQ